MGSAIGGFVIYLRLIDLFVWVGSAKCEDIVDHSHDAMPIHTVLETVFIYSTVDGCSRCGECLALVMDESPLFGDLTKFGDCVLLNDIEWGHHGVWYEIGNSEW